MIIQGLNFEYCEKYLWFSSSAAIWSIRVLLTDEGMFPVLNGQQRGLHRALAILTVSFQTEWASPTR